jgi:hypothetical protein
MNNLPFPTTHRYYVLRGMPSDVLGLLDISGVQSLRILPGGAVVEVHSYYTAADFPHVVHSATGGRVLLLPVADTN